MSFSFDVKEEICRLEEKNTACRISELAGFVLFGQAVEQDHLKIATENVLVINRLQQLSTVLNGVFFKLDETTISYTAEMEGTYLQQLYKMLGIFDQGKISLKVPDNLIKNERQLLAFLRGSLLVGGYISDPAARYHFELVTPYYSLAKSALSAFNRIIPGFRMVVRRSNYVIYLKDSQKIHDVLYILGARSAAFELMNIKIEKETNNNNNRMENCTAYNMDKAMDKAVTQIQAIDHIEKTIGIAALAEDLAYVARLRKENPTKSLTELAFICNGKLSKPSLSRKLNKIIEISNKIKEQA